MEIESSLRPTLPGAYYTSPAMFEIETEQIFARSFMCVGRADEVERVGQVFTAEVGGESVLLTRDRAGRIRGFLNSCRHRGTRLCLGPEEGLTYIRCPYHGWTYGLDGRLLAAPNLHDMPDLQKERHGLLPVAVTTWGGYLWCCLEPDAGPLKAQLEPQIVRRLGSGDALDAYTIEEAGGGPARRLRSSGQLEGARRELHGVLPLPDDPSRADRRRP